MQALVWRGPRQLAAEECPIPEPGRGEVRVRVMAVGICGSELSGYLGLSSLRIPPLVMGHEFSGVIDAVTPESSWVQGTRVVVNPLISCGDCSACRDGRANLCPARQLIGAHRPGAFAEAVIVPDSACLPLPAGTDFVAASLVEPLACAVRAVGLLASPAHDRAASLRVLGAGPIGLLSAMVARRAGFKVTIHDPNRTRASVATEWGLSAPSAKPAKAQAVIDAVGLEETRRSAVSLLEPGGTAVFVGLHESSASFDGNELVREEKAVRGCFAYSPKDFSQALELLTSGLLPDHRRWISERPLTAGKDSFEELTAENPTAVKVVLRPNSARNGGLSA